MKEMKTKPIKHESFEFKVYGDYAMFSDPITKTGGELFSYGVPTYEALKGICESIYWKPTFIYVIDDVRIMNRMQREKMCMLMPAFFTKKGGADRYNHTYLKDVCYHVRAHIEWNENYPQFAKDRIMAKHMAQIKSNIRKGGRRDVYLGKRECQAYVEPCDFNSGNSYYDGIDVDLGTMYHGITYPNEAYDDYTRGYMTVRLWHPCIINGVIHFDRPEKCPSHKRVRPMRMKMFQDHS